jgi:flagellin
MSLNSVNTNIGAMIALESLNKTNASLGSTQKQVSTGLRVADSTDDGAAYAVAQSVRSTVGGLTTANQQLGNVQGLLSTTQSGMNDISNTMASMRDVLVTLSDSNVSGNERTQYQAQYQSLLANVKSDIQDASYGGKTLIGNITGSSGTFSRVATVRNESGASYGLASFGGSAMYNAIAFAFGPGVAGAGTAWNTAGIASHGAGNTGAGSANAIASQGVSYNTAPIPSTSNAAGIAALITAGGTFIQQMNSVGTALNTVGSEVNYVNNQISYNNDKVDALNTGLGALVDADLAKESAQLQALQIRQQLGTQALSLANQAPQTLLSLFK